MCHFLGRARRLLLALIVGLSAIAIRSPLTYADHHEEIGYAIIEVGICHYTGPEVQPWAFTAVQLHELDTHLAHGDIAYVTSSSECAGPIRPRVLDAAGESNDPERRGVPVEVAPLDDALTGGGQGRLPEEEVWRMAIPVEAQPLEDGLTGGAQGIVPEDVIGRERMPVGGSVRWMISV